MVACYTDIVQRLAIILMALLVGAAAPARAWCQATCVVPASSETHCPTHEPVSEGTVIGGASIDSCPVVESARPTTIARVDLKAAIGTVASPQFISSLAPIARIIVAEPVATVFQRHTPLRL